MAVIYRNRNVGCLEAVLIKHLKKPENKSLLESDRIFQTIICNRKIRDILLKDCIIGVVGKNKCGESTFIEEMIQPRQVLYHSYNMHVTIYYTRVSSCNRLPKF
jgi:hypothetical protein